MLQGIENIVFDLGGVMIDLDRARCVEEFHKIGFTEIDDLIDSYHPKGFLGRLERGDVTNDDFYDYVRRSAGRDIADDEIRRAFTSFLAGIPRYKLQMVRTQRERGFRTYALSNINDVVFPFVRDVLFTQEGLQLDDYFEKAYLSYEMHELKPSPRNLPQNDRKERYAPRSDALHRRQCGKSSHGAGTGIPRIYAPAPRRFQVSVRRRPGQMIPKTENRHPKRTAHRCDTGRTFGIIRNRLQAVRLQ